MLVFCSALQAQSGHRESMGSAGNLEIEKPADGNLLLRMSGDWLLGTEAPDTADYRC